MGTFLQTKRSDTILRRSLDAFLSFFVEFNVILAWHGLWTISDIWQAEQKHSNEYTAWISFGIGTFVNIALFFTQFAYSTYTDDIFEIIDEESSKKPNCPTRGFQGLEGFPKIRKSTKLKDILHLIWAHVLGFIFSGLCLVSSVNTFRYSSNKIRKMQIEHLNIIC